MTTTKKLTDSTVPKLTTIADTAIVAVFDPASGAVSKTDFATLKQAVRDSIKIGHRNLLRFSLRDDPISDTQRTAYSLSPLVIGKTYTVTICISVTTVLPRLVFSFQGSSFYDIMQRYSVQPGEKMILSGQVTVTRQTQSGYLWTNGGNATCHWATVTEGNMPSTDWFPAPEDLNMGGGKNLTLSGLRRSYERRVAA